MPALALPKPHAWLSLGVHVGCSWDAITQVFFVAWIPVMSQHYGRRNFVLFATEIQLFPMQRNGNREALCLEKSIQHCVSSHDSVLVLTPGSMEKFCCSLPSLNYLPAVCLWGIWAVCQRPRRLALVLWSIIVGIWLALPWRIKTHRKYLLLVLKMLGKSW